MIRFACKCGFEFDVADDRAGGTTQCPRCGLLVDVPSTAELAWMGQDGTLAVDETAGPAPADDGDRLAELVRTFSSNRYDEFGREIDLRPHPDLASPTIERHRPERITPRYDPETGERILPLSLKDEDPMPVLPVLPLADEDDDAGGVEPRPVEAVPVISMESVKVRPPRRTRRPIPVRPPPVAVVLPVPVEPPPARRVAPRAVGRLGYATGGEGHPTTIHSLPVDLLVRPANLVVLCFVFAFYWLGFLMKTPLIGLAHLVGGSPALFNLLNLPLWVLVAHYGCVVEDVGPDAIDELPRPLRNFAPVDDLFAPALRVTLAAALCYGPAFAVGDATGMGTPPTMALTLALAAAGCYAFPAVVLTLLTGSTVLNLTPLRVLGVISRCGGQYLASAFLAGGVLACSAGVLLGPSVLPPLANVRGLHRFADLALLVPAMFLTMYLTHLFAWHLGLMYRAHHDTFPWLAQRHVRVPRRARSVLP